MLIDNTIAVFYKMCQSNRGSVDWFFKEYFVWFLVQHISVAIILYSDLFFVVRIISLPTFLQKKTLTLPND